MQELTPEEFEGVLRPAFKQDEWILITVGAVLGFLVGELQSTVDGTFCATHKIKLIRLPKTIHLNYS